MPPGPKNQANDKSPAKPPAGAPADQTIVADLSGNPVDKNEHATAATSFRSAATLRTGNTPTPEPGSGDSQTSGRAAREDIQDAIPTHLTEPARAQGSTDATSLHVPGDATADSGGTHLGETWGDFQFIRLLGKGGMGAVYLGRQLSLDRPVAIKVLPSHLSDNPQFRDRFQLEAKAVAKMSSPNVVQVYAAGVHKGHHYFAMEYVEGDDLSRRIKTGLKLSYRQSLELIIQAARGLAAAGEHGIVHRDIKPGNMMIDRKNNLKIMDFGLVRLAAAGHSLTMSGTVMGTVSYFSPEQGRGEPCDQRTDLYALGVVFYELLTGRLPFTGENATSIIYQHIHTPPRSPRELDPNIPQDFQAVVMKCMQKRADDRYVTAQDLLGDLDRLLAGKPPALALERPDLLATGATIVGVGQMFGAAGSAQRRGRKLAIGIAAGAAVAIGAGWFLIPKPEPPPVVVPPVHTGTERALVPAKQPDAAPPTVATPPAVLLSPVVNPELTALRTELAELAALARQQNQNSERGLRIAEAEALVEQGRQSDAERLLDKLVADSPDNILLQNALRRVRTLREQAELQAQKLSALLNDGDQALEQGNFAAAAEKFSAAMLLDAKDPRPSARMQEVKRRSAAAAAAAAAVATVTAPTTPVELVHNTDSALASATAALARGNLPEARRIINVNRGINVDDERWATMAKRLDTAEGKAILHEARIAFTRGEVELAGKSAASAQALIPDDPELQVLLGDIGRVEGDRKQLVRLLLEAESQLNEGHPEKAVELLTGPADKHPEDLQIASTLRRARAEWARARDLQDRINEQLAQGEAALKRLDLDSAHLSFTSVTQSDPKNERAKAGLKEVLRLKDEIEALRKHFNEAIQNGSLATAEADFSRLNELAPSSSVVAMAGSMLNTARLRDEDARRKAEEIESQLQARARTLDTMVDDLARPVPELEKLLKDFIVAGGPHRAEIPTLERKLEDRRCRVSVLANLAELDAAFTIMDSSVLAKHVTDADWVGAVAELSRMPGATMSHSLQQLTRTGDAAVVTVTVKTSLPEAPEESLNVRYELARTASGWQVTIANIQKP